MIGTLTFISWSRLFARLCLTSPRPSDSEDDDEDDETEALLAEIGQEAPTLPYIMHTIPR